MHELFDLEGLAERLQAYARLSRWRPQAATLLTETLHRGEIARGDTAVITGLGERTARALLSELLKNGLLKSASEKGAVFLDF